MFFSPLRYPGGKGKLAPFIGMLIEEYGHKGGTYIEPFAGGAAVAIELLERGIVSQIVINDLDKGIYSFWRTVLTETDRFIEKIESVPLTMDEWQKQRDICMKKNSKYSFELGFATFYMNRTNRSGIIKGGVIGGKEQSGIWRLDARFNKKTLIERIKKIATMKDSIHLYNKDIDSFLTRYVSKYEENALIYFDPPYFEKGKQLYLNFFTYKDHLRIEKLISEKVNCDWIITYDDVPEIEKIYSGYNLRRFELNYSVAKKRKANEIIIFNGENKIPDNSLLEKQKICINLH
ncbi:MAG: DNA adenine methylase [Lachnospiraceae bacterium]|nr:DNA adenine methylase [Lachnospiraceae bacterium]